MLNIRTKAILLIIILILCVVCKKAEAITRQEATASALSQGDFIPNQLKLVFFSGDVTFRSLRQKRWLIPSKGQEIITGDEIRTGRTGYAVIVYSTNNMLLVKPRSTIFFSSVDPLNQPQVIAVATQATVLLSTRVPEAFSFSGVHGKITLRRGEASYQTDGTQDLIKAVQGTTTFVPYRQKTPLKIEEGMMLEIESDGTISAMTPFDTKSEYESFRRFRAWLKYFDDINRLSSPEASYKVDTVMINDRFLSHFETDKDGFFLVDSGNEPVPSHLKIRVKITPYPRPQDRFELYINKDLIFPLSEGSFGFFEAKIPVPSFPDLFLKIRYLDSLGRQVMIFSARLVLLNRRTKIESIKAFINDVSMALERRDTSFFRKRVSFNYRDWFGNDYFDFMRLLDDTVRKYRDIRFLLYPHTFNFKSNLVQVHLNYRFTALTENWNFRYEDVGSDVWTLEFKDGSWQICSKVRGVLLQKMKVVINPKRGILRGRITDEATGTPIADAKIRLLGTSLQTVSDRTGEYIIYNVPPGKYDVEITKIGYGKVTITKTEIKATGDIF